LLLPKCFPAAQAQAKVTLLQADIE
jgi:hypothetical protein